LAIFPNRLYIYLPFMICVGVIPTITSLSVAIYIMKVVSEHRRQIKSQGKEKIRILIKIQKSEFLLKDKNQNFNKIKKKKN